MSPSRGLKAVAIAVNPGLRMTKIDVSSPVAPARLMVETFYSRRWKMRGEEPGREVPVRLMAGQPILCYSLPRYRQG